jgi:hypothetical protein
MLGGAMRLSLWELPAGQKKRAERAALPCCIVTKTALRSLASVALSSVSVRLILSPVPSTIGHFYFAENRTFLLYVDRGKLEGVE